MTGRTIAPVTSGQIYIGAIPFMLIQLLMAVAVALFPALVTGWGSGDATPPAAEASFELPSLGGTLPPLGLPAGGVGGGEVGGLPGLTPLPDLSAPGGTTPTVLPPAGSLPGLATPPGLAPESGAGLAPVPATPALPPASSLPGLAPLPGFEGAAQ